MYWKELRGTCWNGWSMWKEWESKDWLRECNGQMWRGRPQKRWRDDLLLRRGLSEREGMMLARDRDTWAGMEYISE